MLEERVALVVAAGSGIGAAVARELAAQKYRVGILSSSGRGEALAEELGGVGVTGSNLDPEALAALVGRAMDTWGRIDAVVNGAGHGPKGELLEISDEAWHRGVDVYFLNVVRMCRLVTPVMENAGGGAIVNISTFAAFEPDPLFPTSGAFRAALASFTKLYADRYARKNIRMNNVLPGFIDSLPEKDDRRARIPMERYGNNGRDREDRSVPAVRRRGLTSRARIRVDGGLTHSV